MSTYRIAKIAFHQIDAAYVLAQAVLPSLTLNEWRVYCQSVIGRETAGEDIFVAMDAAGHIPGLVVASLRPHLVHKLVLDISVFAVASAADERGIAKALVEYLLGHARIAGCSAARFWDDGHAQWPRHIPSEMPSGAKGVTLLLRAPAVTL